MTYGDGIEEWFTYSRQLERLLRGQRWRVEVVNAGISGAQSEDIVRVARRLIPEMQPDLVIYGGCLNDFLPSGVGQYDGSIRLPGFIRARMRVGPVAELLISNASIRLGITKDFFDDILRRADHSHPVRVVYLHKNSSIWIENVPIIELQCWVLALFPHKAITGDEHLDLAAHEAAKAVLGRAGDRLAAHIEAGIDQDRQPVLALKTDRRAW